MNSLDPRQTEALTSFNQGNSLAILGGAGCGKSYLLQQIIEHAHRRYGEFPLVAACAPTNRVADQLQGRTLHALFGAPPFWRWSKHTLWELLCRRADRMGALRKLQVLIIDEIGYVCAEVLDCIDSVLRKLAPTERDGCTPFGGRQVVFAGDPFQLLPPPQPKTHSSEIPTTEDARRQWEEDRPAYTSRSWFLTFGGFGSGVTVLLDMNHRQAVDPFYYSSLQRVREGKQTLEYMTELNKTGEMKDLSDEYTSLCLRRHQAHEKNLKALLFLPGQVQTHLAHDNFIVNETDEIRNRLNQAAPSRLSLKEGCSVLLLVGIGDLLPGTRVNVYNITATPSSSGIAAIQVQHKKELFTVSPYSFSIRDWDTSVLAIRKQFPLLPGYAITVHRCQGLTLSNVAMDFVCAYRWKPPGMVYVALSRCRSRQNLWVRSLTFEHIVISREPVMLMEKVYQIRARYPTRVISAPIPLSPRTDLNLKLKGKTHKRFNNKRQ